MLICIWDVFMYLTGKSKSKEEEEDVQCWFASGMYFCTWQGIEDKEGWRWWSWLGFPQARWGPVRLLLLLLLLQCREKAPGWELRALGATACTVTQYNPIQLYCRERAQGWELRAFGASTCTVTQYNPIRLYCRERAQGWELRAFGASTCTVTQYDTVQLYCLVSELLHTECVRGMSMLLPKRYIYKYI